MPFAWKRSPEETFVAAFEQYDRAVVGLVVSIFEINEADIQAWMKSNAPWTDRTGDARRELSAETKVDRNAGTVAMVLSHGVYYGVYLETMQGGRFSILGPAIDLWAPELFYEVRTILG